jgi:hypothetical protein
MFGDVIPNPRQGVRDLLFRAIASVQGREQTQTGQATPKN